MLEFSQARQLCDSWREWESAAGMETRLDILTALEEAGLDCLVISILALLKPRHLCAALQVSSAWSAWDCGVVWSRLLAVRIAAHPSLARLLQTNQSDPTPLNPPQPAPARPTPRQGGGEAAGGA